MQLVAQFVNVSFVGSRALAKALGQAADGVMISQVMPPPTANKFPIIAEYQKAMKAAGAADLSYTSLEGYIAAKVLVEALRRGWHVIAPDWRGHSADLQEANEKLAEEKALLEQKTAVLTHVNGELAPKAAALEVISGEQGRSLGQIVRTLKGWPLRVCKMGRQTP